MYSGMLCTVIFLLPLCTYGRSTTQAGHDAIKSAAGRPSNVGVTSYKQGPRQVRQKRNALMMQFLQQHNGDDSDASLQCSDVYLPVLKRAGITPKNPPVVDVVMEGVDNGSTTANNSNISHVENDYSGDDYYNADLYLDVDYYNYYNDSDDYEYEAYADYDLGDADVPAGGDTETVHCCRQHGVSEPCLELCRTGVSSRLCLGLCQYMFEHIVNTCINRFDKLLPNQHAIFWQKYTPPTHLILDKPHHSWN